ncbi:MAG: ribosomal-processing cysteine protease Prp [Lachnospiraceae bacterium]|nr:ribosomal-processing cysteine protease Prp [Lachnospiraceae bacterium]
MTRITIQYDENGVPRKLRLSGHTGYASSGEDVVCAAVSALTINTVNSLEYFLPEDKFRDTSDEKKGFIEFEFVCDPSEKAQLLVNSLIFGLKNIKDQYGNTYLKITEKPFGHSRRPPGKRQKGKNDAEV